MARETRSGRREAPDVSPRQQTDVDTKRPAADAPTPSQLAWPHNPWPLRDFLRPELAAWAWCDLNPPGGCGRCRRMATS
jgi:hypothetical protein